MNNQEAAIVSDSESDEEPTTNEVNWETTRGDATGNSNGGSKIKADDAEVIAQPNKTPTNDAKCKEDATEGGIERRKGTKTRKCCGALILCAITFQILKRSSLVDVEH